MASPGHIAALVAKQKHDFEDVTLIINNVKDRAESEAMAVECRRRGDISRYVFVEDHLDEALATTGFRKKDFGRFLHWSDVCLVGTTITGPPVLLWWDDESELVQNDLWIPTSIELLRDDPSIFCASPLWGEAGSPQDTAELETDRRQGEFLIGYGFTDVCFLALRDALSSRIRTFVPWWIRSPVSARYPIRHTLCYEQAVDVHMRSAKLMRAVSTRARMVARGDPASPDRYRAYGLKETVAVKRSSLLLRASDRLSARTANPRVRRAGLMLKN
ncbi:MAG: hypothetical protein AB7Q42_00410 [Acidimicrobiia bacterium]